MSHRSDPLPAYEPPTGDEPLDPIQQARVRMFVRIIAREIREEEAALAAKRPRNQNPRRQPDE
jgi:hypothetical protein